MFTVAVRKLQVWTCFVCVECIQFNRFISGFQSFSWRVFKTYLSKNFKWAVGWSSKILKRSLSTSYCGIGQTNNISERSLKCIDILGCCNEVKIFPQPKLSYRLWRLGENSNFFFQTTILCAVITSVVTRGEWSHLADRVIWPPPCIRFLETLTGVLWMYTFDR